MKRSYVRLFSLLVCLVLAVSTAFAGSDEFMGDSAIYAGVPSTLTRPNVLLVIDNSRATAQMAPGAPYSQAIVYDQMGGCEGTSNPAAGCFLPWNIYEIDNQGDIANQVVVANTTVYLENLSSTDAECVASDDVARKTLQLRGTYSSSGTESFPNIKLGACETGPTGSVYVLGNYLNYTMSVSGSGESSCTDLDPPDIVKSVDSITQINCLVWQNKNICKEEETVDVIVTSYYQALQTHTADAAVNHPVTGTTSTEYWAYLSPDGVYPTATEWQDGTEYVAPVCETDVVVDEAMMSQREIIYSALEAAIGSALGAVNFGVMTYSNNGGAELVYDVTDLSLVPDPDDPTADPTVLTEPPVCYNSTTGLAVSANEGLEYCKLLARIPGPDRNGDGVYAANNDWAHIDGAPLLNDPVARPQAEAVYDAGYYLGADYSEINAVGRIPAAIKNECDLNHIILLTNGFTSNDGSPNLSVVGDADSDNYPDEDVYGLGSHWLDDVAKYLNYNFNMTTHTILAFQEKDSLIQNAAKDGDGKFFNVYNHEELAAALTQLLATIINEKSTSFVAPVVPASTTNRTISSNNVYLGLFRPQQTGPWFGNIKKYGISLETLQLKGYDGTPATDAYGDFDRDSTSYWSLNDSGLIPSSDGYIYPGNSDPNEPKGDGGQVDAGGAGGVMLERAKYLAALVRAAGDWETSEPDWRNIYTLIDETAEIYESANHFLPDTSIMPNWGNDNITAADLGVATDAEKNALIKFLHGFTYEEVDLPSSAQARNWILGDILHSRPVVFNYTKYTSLQENTCWDDLTADQQNNKDMHNSSVIFAGSNDGMLHAIRDCDGQEIWAFIPPNVLDSLSRIKDPVVGHATFVDAAPSLFVHDANENGYIDQTDDKVVMVVGQRRGGGKNILNTGTSHGSYYALDVTDPDQPKYLWSVDNLDLGEIGETWSQPRLAKVPIDGNNFKLVAFVGTGYDNNEDLRYGDTQTFPNSSDDGSGDPVDINTASAGGTVDGTGGGLTSAGTLAASVRENPRGRGILAIEVAHLSRADATSPYIPTVTGGTVGTVYWSYTAGTGNYNGDEPEFSFASDLTVLDLDSDTFADTIYVGDTGGNIWRFKVNDATPSNWTGTILFASNPGADSSVGRKIFYKPTVAYVGAPHIYFGTGDREHPLNLTTEDRIYCLIDWGADGTFPVTESSLEDVTLNTIQDKDTTATDAQAIYDRLYSHPGAPYNEDGDFTYGWYIKLDGTDRDVNGDPGEKVLAPATVFNGEAFFSTYQLYTGPRAGCDAGNLGISRLYQVDYKTGEAVLNFDESNDLTADTISGVNERAIGGENGEILQRTDRVRTLGEGIPSGIVTLIDASGRVTQLISSSDRVEASGLKDVKLISPVYWMQW